MRRDRCVRVMKLRKAVVENDASSDAGVCL